MDTRTGQVCSFEAAQLTTLSENRGEVEIFLSNPQQRSYYMPPVVEAAVLQFHESWGPIWTKIKVASKERYKDCMYRKIIF